MEGAALICGEVLRRAAGLVWYVDHGGSWFIATPKDDWPAIVLFPLVRLREIQIAGAPQFGRYHLWLIRAVLDYLSIRGNEKTVAELIDWEDENLDSIDRAREFIRTAGRRG